MRRATVRCFITRPVEATGRFVEAAVESNAKALEFEDEPLVNLIFKGVKRSLFKRYAYTTLQRGRNLRERHFRSRQLLGLFCLKLEMPVPPPLRR